MRNFSFKCQIILNCINQPVRHLEIWISLISGFLVVHRPKPMRVEVLSSRGLFQAPHTQTVFVKHFGYKFILSKGWRAEKLIKFEVLAATRFGCPTADSSEHICWYRADRIEAPFVPAASTKCYVSLWMTLD